MKSGHTEKEPSLSLTAEDISSHGKILILTGKEQQPYLTVAYTEINEKCCTPYDAAGSMEVVKV